MLTRRALTSAAMLLQERIVGTALPAGAAAVNDHQCRLCPALVTCVAVRYIMCRLLLQVQPFSKVMV